MFRDRVTGWKPVLLFPAQLVEVLATVLAIADASLLPKALEQAEVYIGEKGHSIPVKIIIGI